MNQKKCLITLPAPKHEGNGVEYMISDAGMGSNILIRDMIFLSEVIKITHYKRKAVLYYFFHLFLRILKHVNGTSLVYVHKKSSQDLR